MRIGVLPGPGHLPWASDPQSYRGSSNLALAAIAVAISATDPGRASLDHALGIAGSLSGLWWAAIVLVVAVLISVVTHTLGREHSHMPGHPAAWPAFTGAASACAGVARARAIHYLRQTQTDGVGGGKRDEQGGREADARGGRDR